MIFGMRAPSSFRRVAVALGLVGFASAAAFFGLSAESVDAQQPENPTLAVETLVNDGQLGVDITIDPGTTQPGAVQGQINYDPDVVTFIACDHLEGFGACRAEEGFVYFGTFVVETWAAESSVLVMNFDILDEDKATRFDLDVEMVFDADGQRLEFDAVDGIYGEAEDLDDDATSDEVDADGGIEGRVIDADGAGIAAVDVCATSDLTGRRTCDSADVFGDYEIGGLATAPYTVTVSDPQEIYEDGEATDVGVISPRTTSDVDIAMALPTETEQDVEDTDDTEETDTGTGRDFISGTVRDADRSGVASVQVCADGVGTEVRSCDLTSRDGSYRIDGLSSGNYQMTVSDPEGRFDDDVTRTVGLDDAVGRPAVNFAVEVN